MAKGKFTFFSLRVEKLNQPPSPTEQQPQLNFEEQTASFLVSKEQFQQIVANHGHKVGPQSFQGWLGEKVGVASAFLTRAPGVTGEQRPNLWVNGKDVESFQEALHPETVWSVHSGGSKSPLQIPSELKGISHFWADFAVRYPGIFLGVPSIQEYSETGTLEVHQESKMYPKSGIKKAAQAAKGSAWAQEFNSSEKIVKTSAGEQTVLQTKKNLVIVSSESPEKLANLKLPEPDIYDAAEGFIPEDQSSGEALFELTSK